jgi:CheY-like chemotaxis protein
MPLTSEQPTSERSAPSAGQAFDGGAIERLGAALPYLRRYARAVTGSQHTGDSLVRETLEAALADPEVLARISGSRAGLYQAFTVLWTSLDDPEGDRPQAFKVPTLARQALLLNQLEEFSLAETAQILGTDEAGAGELVEQALADMARDAVADVLIIEDEPLIADHLKDIVSDGGHRTVAHATTAAEARLAFDRHNPSLVLSDVQLADGSSGIDAVEDILEQRAVPVIFITGFPEKLLTGEGPEPAFLITKPFRDETVRATISQALFFGARLSD